MLLGLLDGDQAKTSNRAYPCHAAAFSRTLDPIEGVKRRFWSLFFTHPEGPGPGRAGLDDTPHGGPANFPISRQPRGPCPPWHQGARSESRRARFAKPQRAGNCARLGGTEIGADNF